ncbi:MAG: hypothetical protein CVT98_04700 [Bacteroidetes bacterium HGW-Bacteroidetes-15]|nr:MAG: hypothetical protein CVT98_04700 [Bacteroidetes bacterium HGW-Bacteroidetes-15]
MRKIYLILACTLIALSMQAQTVIRFKTHGLVADHVNEMKITKYTEPGADGRNVVWDFRTLELTRDFIGSLDNPALSKGASTFTESNTLLEEFGNYFYFKTSEAQIEQHGFMSANGNVKIIYDTPFVKMKYPFSFGSSYSGSFDGRYIASEREAGTLQGSYSVDGDGLGTLMLPGNMVYENVLRIKEVKSYNQILNNRSYDIETITYRWYANDHRFPILVLISNTTTYQDGRIHNSTQAAYNPVALNESNTPLDIETYSSINKLEAFPNPYHDQITIRVNLEETSTINLSVFDINGRLVKVLVKGSIASGEKSYNFSAKEMGLGVGAYIVKLNVNGKETSKRILEL